MKTNNLVRLLIVASFLLSCSAQAQPRTVVLNGSRSPPPWIETSGDSHLTYLTALWAAQSAIGGYLGHEPSADDLLVLTDAIEKLESGDSSSDEYRNQLCQRSRVADTTLSSRELVVVGDDFNVADELYADEIYLLFEETVSKLSKEAGDALHKIQKSVTGTSNSINWRKYAELAPKEMEKTAASLCRSALKAK